MFLRHLNTVLSLLKPRQQLESEFHTCTLSWKSSVLAMLSVSRARLRSLIWSGFAVGSVEA